MRRPLAVALAVVAAQLFRLMRWLDAATTQRCVEIFLYALRKAAARQGESDALASWAVHHLGITCPNCGATSPGPKEEA